MHSYLEARHLLVCSNRSIITNKAEYGKTFSDFCFVLLLSFLLLTVDLFFLDFSLPLILSLDVSVLYPLGDVPSLWFLFGSLTSCFDGPTTKAPPWFGRFNLALKTKHRGSYISAHVLLNLLYELGKRDKMRGLHSILSLFHYVFNKFINTRA